MGAILDHIRVIIAGWSCIETILEVYLSYRQYKKATNVKDVPEELADLVTDSEHRVASAYEADKVRFGMFSDGINLVQSIFNLFVVRPWLWDLCVRICGEQSIYRVSLLMCYAMYLEPLGFCVDLALSYYSTFVIEERHGFNKTTLNTYIMDRVKGLVLSVALGVPIQLIVIKVVIWGGDQFHIYLWVCSIVLTIIMIAILPVVVMPLFNKFEPLKDEDLRCKIEVLADRLDFPLYKLLQMDGSKRSAHSNAFFYGVWRFKRIVLFDTLLDMDHDQILSILCHELGHWKMWHTIFNMLFQFAVSLFFTSVYSFIHGNAAVFEAFGFTTGRYSECIIIGFPIISMLLIGFNLILGRAQTIMTRKFEYEADAFAHQMDYNEELQAALGALHKENKSFGDPDEWYAWYHFSHPTVLERRKHLKDLNQKRQ